ncbi:protein-tyrosine-phosphatase [Sphingobium lactosutens]|uniref:tyrosine-protein phosphatase n=1 Tax=Sphingobium lactosutens TaxID=522773 RepID=UPI0015B79F98|nr:tyrosine-protein phosphatase [Sphingobium lactosutens]NWK94397.1 protein-tyrosine-phosphatase [Sphingobium lactosutens]
MRITLTFSLALIALSSATPGIAREAASLTRIDAQSVALERGDIVPTGVWISKDDRIDNADQKVDVAIVRAIAKGEKITLPIPASERRYVLLKDKGGKVAVAGERVLPIEQGSNFRDIGGYVTKDGHAVRWGKAFRSGAMPLFTEADYALVGQLGIGSVVDLRSLEERDVAPDQIDDRTGALFIANDYKIAPLMANFSKGNGENVYKGMEKMLVPQLRALYRRIEANEGAVVYHCSAGQDRTGMATAILYDVLGVDRDTILKDYHMSTALRRPQYEMPKVNPADYPNNPILKYYFSADEKKRAVAEPLYTPTGASHLAQFFTYIDSEYGGSEGYMKKALGLTDTDIAKLRAAMLD